MTTKTSPVDYSHDGKVYQGFLARDDAASGKRPTVLIAHAWAGRGPIEEFYAKRLAGLGYAGFALDFYGKGVFGKSAAEC